MSPGRFALSQSLRALKRRRAFIYEESWRKRRKTDSESESVCVCVCVSVNERERERERSERA